MNFQVSTQAYIVVALPFVLSFINTSLGAMLSQRHFSSLVNGVIVWVTLILGALLSMYASGKFTQHLSYGQLIDAFSATITLLLSGALCNLKPYSNGYMSWLRDKVFNVIKPIVDPQATQPALRAVSAMRQVTQSAQAPVRPTSPIPQRTTLVPTPQQDNGG